MILTPLRRSLPGTAAPASRPVTTTPVTTLRPLRADTLQAPVRSGLVPIRLPMAGPGATPAPASVLGTVDYYRWRAADFARRHPGQPVPDYYLGYGDKYIHRFTDETAPKLSAKGQVWLDKARLNLQTAIEGELRRDPVAFDKLEQQPRKFTRFAYGTHPNAYLKAGISGLPVRDLVAIGGTPDPKDLLTCMGLTQMAIVATHVVEEVAGRELAVVGAELAPGVTKALAKAGATEGRLLVRTAVRAL